jgi:hypothetical protein
MSRFRKLSHTIWHCKLCTAEHNWHYVLTVIMWSQRYNVPCLQYSCPENST